MNEAAIKALTALVNQPLPELVHNAVIGAIEELEAEDQAERVRQNTLCQDNGMALTTNPSLYKCRWCGCTWYCHDEPPVCPDRRYALRKVFECQRMDLVEGTYETRAIL